MISGNILIADDDPHIRMLLKDRLEGSGFRVRQAGDGREAIDRIAKGTIDLALLDIRMPGMDGLEALKQIRSDWPDLPVIMLTAFASIDLAVQAMKLGAYDFLPKPCDPDHILITVHRALRQHNLKEENRFLKSELEEQYHMVVGESCRMKEIMSLAQRVAPSKTTVLIGGESGTGKQLLARAIHGISDRKDRPFVQVNCTTLSEQLMESDLFGHERGAFTGAVSRKRGRFEQANGGTFFLDEIGDLDMAIQAKLLHVIEYGEFQRVGGIDTLHANVRIIAASNRDLGERVKEGLFREDLLYRLNVFVIELPALRERSEDIPILADYFLHRHAGMLKKKITGFTREAMNILQNYPWPGNIRELENAVERAVVLASNDSISADLLPDPGNRQTGTIAIGASLDEAVSAFKRRFIAETLAFTGNNQTKAAKILDIQRTYLNRLIKDLGIH